MTIGEALLNWYDANARELPWRGTHDPYRIWLSEIMLQQTRTGAVTHYYERFLSCFSNVFALAEAPLDEVLKLWEGLGYYSRARNLHKTARLVASMGGMFPESVEELQKLPGIGPYVARAIASIAFNAAVPALDGNHMRVLSRCFALERVLQTPFDLEAEALSCLDPARPGDYNQALMDLGATICTPKNPQCGICPLRGLCRACESGDAERYPLRPAPITKREELRTVFVVSLPQGIAIRRRPEHGLLGGLYEFPSAEGHLTCAEVQEQLSAMGFSDVEVLEALRPAKHVFTHLIWRMSAWHARAGTAPESFLPVDAEGLRAHAFPSALRPYYECALQLLSRES